MRNALLIALTACTWQAPDNPNTLSAPPLPNMLSGLVSWPGDANPADTFITVYEADNPGPPTGLGAPITLATVTGTSFTSDTTGLLSAEWAVGDLPDGDFLVNALMDVDGDFHPFADILTGATCGDWVGTHLETLESTEPGVVSARGGVEVDSLPVVLGVEMSTERPVFQLPDADSDTGVVLSRQIGKQSGSDSLLTASMLYTVETDDLQVALADELTAELGPACQPPSGLSCDGLAVCPCDAEAYQVCDTALWLWFVDDDGDGAVDPYPGDLQADAGFYDVWPRIYIEYIGEPITQDDGSVVYESGLAEGERWVSENFPLGLELLTNPDVTAYGPLGVPFPARSLSVLWSPVFRHYWPGGTDGEDVSGPFDYLDLRAADVAVDAVPAGHYSITVVSFTGQTWTLPNEAGLLSLPSLDPQDDASAQAGVLFIE